MELTTAANIKSRLNRHAVIESLTAIRGAIKDIRKLPKNGLAIFAGAGHLEIFEPPAPLRRNIYRCDSRFHIEPVLEAIDSIGEPIGIVIMTGDGIWLGVADGTRREIKQKYLVSLPQKHNKGGQSALRFSRLADEARHNYVTKAVELCCGLYMKDGTPTVKGLVFAGNGDIKYKCVDALPDPLRQIVLAVEDFAYGGEVGFAAACSVAEKKMSSATLQVEKRELDSLEAEIQKDRGLYLLGKEQVLEAIEAGAVEKLLLAMDAEESIELKAVESGAIVMRISDQTPEGTRFISGLTGVGALLRWPFKPHDEVGVGAVVDHGSTENQKNDDEEFFFM